MALVTLQPLQHALVYRSCAPCALTGRAKNGRARAFAYVLVAGAMHGSAEPDEDDVEEREEHVILGVRRRLACVGAVACELTAAPVP